MPITTYNCTALTGGAARALDSYSRLALADGDRAVVALSTNKLLYFKYSAAATDAEDVAAHPYKVRPDDYSAAGVWIAQEAGVAPASTTKSGIVELATNAEAIAGTEAALAVTPAGDLAARQAERTYSAENIAELIQYPIPASGYMLKAAADGSPATATNTDTDVASAVSLKHTQNTDTGTTATSFKINTGGNEADLQTTGLTADRDYRLPDIDTMLAGAAATVVDATEIIVYATSSHIADAKTDYGAGELDDESEVIAAINTLNGKINSILVALETAGILAAA